MFSLSALSNPRSIDEVVKLFDDMLFDRLNAGAHAGRDIGKKTDGALTLTDAGRRELENSNVLNRIFRAWHQLTWLEEDVSDLFSGSTFRHELSAYDPDIAAGRAMLSVAFERAPASPYYPSAGSAGEYDLAVVPRYFSADDLDATGGPFCYALRELEQREDNDAAIVAPNYDPSFWEYAHILSEVKQHAEKLLSYTLHDVHEEEVYWQLYFHEAGMALVRDIYSGTPEETMALAQTFTALLRGHAGMQKDGEVECIAVDNVIGSLWYALSEYDDTLISYESVTQLPDDPHSMDQKMQDEKVRHSVTMLYRIGFLFDKHVLFPADRYFNAVEIVWQDKMTFLHNLAVFHQLCNMQTRDAGSPTPEDRIQSVFVRIAQQLGSQSRYGLWFNPPAYYRFHERVLKNI